MKTKWSSVFSRSPAATNGSKKYSSFLVKRGFPLPTSHLPFSGTAHCGQSLVKSAVKLFYRFKNRDLQRLFYYGDLGGNQPPPTPLDLFYFAVTVEMGDCDGKFT